MMEKKVLIKEDASHDEQPTLKEIYDKYNKVVNTDEAYKYINAYVNRKNKIAMGVACFILSVIFPMLTDIIYGTLFENICMCLFFVMIVVGVLLIVNANTNFKDTCASVPSISSATVAYLNDELSIVKKAAYKLRTIGILFCSFSFFPVILLDSFYADDFGVILMFIMIAIGVFNIISSTSKIGAYNKLLK